jgi:hypothetical protein
MVPVQRELKCAFRIGEAHRTTCPFRDQNDLNNSPHLRRLGILLIELATGIAITEIRHEQGNNSITGLSFWEGNPPGEHYQILQESLTRVHISSQRESFRRAVEYCLRDTLTPNQAANKDYVAHHLRNNLAEYNHQVLMP